MAIFPVILCGGAGTRLWPASRIDRPKQFIDLTGGLSLFQETIRRVAPLADSGGRLFVVASQEHEEIVGQQLSEIGVDAVVVFEPAGRDSAPAMAAAALVIDSLVPAGIALFVAADHHVPDADAFRGAVYDAADAARQGRIVTFGVTPTEASSAYGYIEPEGEGLSPVRRFVEKPDSALAAIYVQRGLLWNSGNFMVRTNVLIEEMGAFAADVIESVRASMPRTSNGSCVKLTDAFLKSPRISIDYAVMEKSNKVSVMPVSFGWSDLGAWDSVASTGLAQRGIWIGSNGDTPTVRAAPGILVATAGISNVAIVAEHDAVLVCSLDRAQDVKGLVERIRLEAPQHLKSQVVGVGLVERAQAFDTWMRFNALPLWATAGLEPDGGFAEEVERTGAPRTIFRRARVQTRQAWVYAMAGLEGWSGPWSAIVSNSLDRFETTNLRADGLYMTKVSSAGVPLDDTASLYDQAFALLAFSAAVRAGVQPVRMAGRATALRDALDSIAHPTRGWLEHAGPRYQANAHMHLFEASLDWETHDPAAEWRGISDEIADLARSAFIDPEHGFLREFFDATWKPAPDALGQIVEPGHQFEWAWLLAKWGRRRNESWALTAAKRLYAAGKSGIDHRRNVVVDKVDPNLAITSFQARLWPQTERLKAALMLGEADAVEALASLQSYLEPTGLWRDKMNLDGSFILEPAPASSLYHIFGAWLQIRKTIKFPRMVMSKYIESEAASQGD